MDDPNKQARDDLVVSNHILANESVLDAFGHVSVRHPSRPAHFLLSCSRAPELVTADDILEFDEKSELVGSGGPALYIERFIHGEIYRVRPDVHAVCHHHAPAIMPFSVAGVPILPVYQHGAMIGAKVPLWDSRTEHGDTNLLVTDSEQGASLARALGPNWVVLMRHHGATVVGKTLTELVFRSITACRNAEFQLAALALGPVQGLSAGEIAKAAQVNPKAMDRALAYWKSRIPARTKAAESQASTPRS
jgi:ribulose-5-phosphate 4-epimerase/fuculose-1-phosphate aldolase